MSDAKSRYNKKTYDMLAVQLHKERDADIIQAIKELTDTGMTKSDVIKLLLRKAIEANKN